MTDSSVDKKDETKPVLGYPQSGQLSDQIDHNYLGYQYPQYYQYPGDGQPNYLGYPDTTMPPPLYFYQPNCQSNYYDDNTPQPQSAPPKRKLLTFPRIFCCLLTIIILSATIFALVLWYFNKVDVPSFEVVSVVINSFQISNTSILTANWEIDVEVNNPNRKSDIRFEHIANSLMYKYAVLETSFSAPFILEKNNRLNFRADFDIPNHSHQKMGGLKVFDMARERRKTGELSFDLKIEAKILSRNNGKPSGPRKTLYIYCEDIVLEFKNSSSLPEWDGYIVECYDDESDESSLF